MSETSGVDDPYRTPEANPGEGSSGAAPRRPKGLTVVCVLAIMIGALSVMHCVTAAFGLVVPIDAFGSPGDQQQVENVLAKVQARLAGSNQSQQVVSPVLLTGFLIVSLLLIVGGIKGLAIQPVGMKLLAIAFWASIPLEICWGAEVWIETSANLETVDEMMVDPEMHDQFSQMVLMLTRILTIGSTVTGFVTLAARLLYYGLSLRYIRRDSIRELFAAQEADQA
jgi:hypothetical protein